MNSMFLFFHKTCYSAKMLLVVSVSVLKKFRNFTLKYYGWRIEMTFP